MKEFEVDAWLGDTRPTLSDQQVEQVRAAFEKIEARYAGRDLDDDAEVARIGATQILLGDETLRVVAQRYLDARQVERNRMAALTGAIIASAQSMTEVQITDVTGVNRMTVRKALSK